MILKFSKKKNPDIFKLDVDNSNPLIVTFCLKNGRVSGFSTVFSSIFVRKFDKKSQNGCNDSGVTTVLISSLYNREICFETSPD